MEPALHLAIPFAVVMLAARRLRYALIAGIFGVLPDFDVFFRVHRSVSHSFIPAIAIVVIYLVAAVRLKKKMPLLLSAALGLAAHSSLDFLGGYTPLLWPIYPNELFLSMDIRLQSSSPPSLYIDYSLMERQYSPMSYEFLDSPLASAEGVLISALLVLSALLSSRGRVTRKTL